MNQTVYKIVSLPFGTFSHMYSVFMRGENRLEYKLNETLVRNEAPIFCFLTLERAKDFMEGISTPCAILECSTSQTYKPEHSRVVTICRFGDDALVEQYWRGTFDYGDPELTDPIPEDTIFVKDLTPLRIAYTVNVSDEPGYRN